MSEAFHLLEETSQHSIASCVYACVCPCLPFGNSSKNSLCFVKHCYVFDIFTSMKTDHI